jgi:hypothetical protein
VGRDLYLLASACILPVLPAVHRDCLIQNLPSFIRISPTDSGSVRLSGSYSAALKNNNHFDVVMNGVMNE